MLEFDLETTPRFIGDVGCERLARAGRAQLGSNSRSPPATCHRDAIEGDRPPRANLAAQPRFDGPLPASQSEVTLTI